MNRVSEMEQEKSVLEKKLYGMSEEFGRVQSTMEARKQLMKERDSAMIAFATKYKIAGFDSGPFSTEQSKKLISKGKSLLQGLRDRITSIKNDQQNQLDQLDKSLDKSKEELQKFKQELNQLNKTYSDNQKKISSFTSELQQKEQYHGKLNNAQLKISEEEKILDEMKRVNNIDEINNKIESLRKKKEENDAKITQLSNLMKNLNLQASSRAKLNIKKSEKRQTRC